MPSMGQIMGTQSLGELYTSIGGETQRVFFNGQFDDLRQNFYQTHVAPVMAAHNEVEQILNRYVVGDTFRPLTDYATLANTPSCMELPILMMPQIRQLYAEGRISGYGWNLDTLPKEDTYGRLLNNFHCDDVAEASDAEGRFTIRGTWYSDDPDLTPDELYSIRLTREYMERHILPHTEFDPTDISQMRS